MLCFEIQHFAESPNIKHFRLFQNLFL